MKETFGELIRRRREALDIKSYELARRLNRQPSIISRIETGAYKEVPPVDVLAGLARELGLSQAEMLFALGYEVGVSVDDSSDSPVVSNLIAKLRTIRLTDERADGLERLLDLWRDLDAKAQQRVNENVRANR